MFINIARDYIKIRGKRKKRINEGVMKGKREKKRKTREKNIRQLTVTSTTYYSIEQQRQRLFNQLLSISFRIRMLYLFLQNYRLLLS